MKHTTSRTGTQKHLLHAVNSRGSIAGVLQAHLCALNVHLMQRQSNFILGKILWMNYFLYSNFSVCVR